MPQSPMEIFVGIFLAENFFRHAFFICKTIDFFFLIEFAIDGGITDDWYNNRLIMSVN
jgi:hypothetical protein